MEKIFVATLLMLNAKGYEQEVYKRIGLLYAESSQTPTIDMNKLLQLFWGAVGSRYFISIGMKAFDMKNKSNVIAYWKWHYQYTSRLLKRVC
jgi:hypothetical protein